MVTAIFEIYLMSWFFIMVNGQCLKGRSREKSGKQVKMTVSFVVTERSQKQATPWFLLECTTLLKSDGWLTKPQLYAYAIPSCSLFRTFIPLKNEILKIPGSFPNLINAPQLLAWGWLVSRQRIFKFKGNNKVLYPSFQISSSICSFFRKWLPFLRTHLPTAFCRAPVTSLFLRL